MCGLQQTLSSFISIVISIYSSNARQDEEYSWSDRCVAFAGYLSVCCLDAISAPPDLSWAAGGRERERRPLWFLKIVCEVGGEV